MTDPSVKEPKPEPRSGDIDCRHRYTVVWCDSVTDVVQCLDCGRTKEVSCNFDEEYS